jgi:hypothetical protein
MNKNRYCQIFEGAKHDSEGEFAKKDQLNVKVCMFVQRS